MPSHPLQRRLEDVRRRVLRLLIVRGASALAARVVAAVVLLGSVDYAMRFRDRGVLVIFAATVVGVFLCTVYGWLKRLSRARLGDTDLALQLEARFPEVKDRLASAVEFLGEAEDDATAGSAAMRRAAISATEAACDRLDFTAALDARPARGAALTTLAVGFVAAMLVVLNPTAVRTALARLAMPLGSAAWPQKTHLALKRPIDRVARGQPLEIEVVDARGATLPADCRVHWRLRDGQGNVTQESEAMQPLADAMIARRENLNRPLEFRVTGGDDRSMAWQPVDVLDPPAVSELKIDVTPPAYTHWPRQTREVAGGPSILAGSHVELHGQATKPLRAAELHMDNGVTVQAQLAADGRAFCIGAASPGLPRGILLEKPRTYMLKVIDRDGLSGEESGQFPVLPDSPPVVMIERPRSNLVVTPQARVPVRVDVRDDLGLHEVSLIYSVTGASAPSEAALSLFASPSQAEAESFDRWQSGGGESRSFDYVWDLETLKLQPGTQFTFAAAATDYSPQTARSEPRTLSIVTPDELQQRLAAKQNQVVSELERLLANQRNAAQQVDKLRIELHEKGRFGRDDLDRLQAAEFSQREVVRLLRDPADGVRAMVRGVLDDLAMNRLDSPDLARRMQGLLDAFGRIEREHTTAIGSALTDAIKGAQVRLQESPPPVGRDTEDEARLAAAGEHQRQVIETLDEVLSQLRQWNDYRRFRGDVAQLLHDQEEVARGTADLARRTLGRDLKEFTLQESIDMKILVERQADVARREEGIEQAMEQTIGHLRADEPLAADTLGDALAEARRLTIAAAMQAAAGQIRDARLNSVPNDQEAICRNLQSVLDIVANTRGRDSERLARQLNESERDLDNLRKGQAGLVQKLDGAAGSGKTATSGARQRAALHDEQEAIRQETERVARRLKRLWAEEPATAAGAAATKMKESSDDCLSGSVQIAAKKAREAKKLLDETADKLRQEQMQLRIQQQVEERQHVEETVKQMRQQEVRIEAETGDFARRQAAGELTRAQEFGLVELARQQDLLRDEADRLVRSLDEASAFRLGLTAAGEEMKTAAMLLQRQQTGSATRQAEHAAIERLSLLLAAFEPMDSEQMGKGGDHRPPGRQNSSRGPQNLLLLAELKFVKLWQEDVNRRTQQLDADAAGKTPDEYREQSARLAEEQDRLCVAAARFLKPQEGKGQPANGKKKEERDDIEN